MNHEKADAETPENSSEKFFTKPLIIIFVTLFIDIMGFGVALPVLPGYAKDYFGASPLVIGWLIASYSIMQFLSTPFLGHLSDRHGRRPILLISLLGTSVAALITALAPSLVILFLGRIFDGITGGNISTAQAYIADTTSKKNRAKGMGLIGAAFGLGFIFGPAIGGILSQFSPHLPFFFVSGLALTNATMLYFFLPESLKKDSQPAEPAQGNRIVELFRSLSNPHFGTLTAVYFFLVTSFSIMNYAFLLYTMERFGFTPEENGYVFTFIGILAVIFQGGLVGKLTLRFGENALMIVGSLLMAASLFGIPFVYPAFGGLTALLFVTALLVIGNSMASTSVQSLVSKNADESEQGKALGIVQSGASLARAIGPALGGFLLNNAINQVDDFTIRRTFWTATAIMIISTAIAAYFAMRHPRSQTVEFQ